MFNTFIKGSNEYTDREKSVPAPYLRKGFTLDFAPESAELLIAVSGFYELYVNGMNITKGFLAPYISNPDDMLCYDEYDVAKYLKKGKNAIGIILGNGFANQCMRAWKYDEAAFRAPLCASVELKAHGLNQSFTLTSDETFKTHPSHITYDMYRYGTHIDARLYIDGWCTPEFDDSSWCNALLADTPKGTILPCTVNPITVRHELKPISIKEQKDICYLKTALKNGTDIPSTKISGYLYDFGQSCAGICKLTIKGEPGQKITLRHGERLADDGGFNINSIYTFRDDYADYIHLFQTDVFTLKGNETELFIPPFTYHGFRYVFVEGITEKQATKELLTFEILSSDIKQRGDFSCSDDTVNTLYKMVINADISNFHYFPTDCPHREKNGWTGDISVSAEQLLLAFDCSEEFKVWLRTLGYAQKPDGSLPGIAPTGGWGFAWGNGPMWDSACVNLPYYAYKYDGRTDILNESSDTIFRYLKYVASRRDENGLIAIGLGDWCQPGDLEEPIAAPLVLTDSAISYDMAVKSAFIFDVLGDVDRCAYATNLATELKTAIKKHLIDHTTMTASGNCQTSQALLLALGLFDQNEAEAAYKRLIELTEEKDGHAVCGMIGLRYIFEVLARRGDIDLALHMICRKDEPSYGSMIQRGATALCEALMENGLNESENHHFLGDILRIFQSYIAGLHINPNMKDINEIVFAPIIPSMLNEANGSYQFKSGICKFGWYKNDNGITSYITVPKNVHGHFVYQDKTIQLKEGENSFLITK